MSRDATGNMTGGGNVNQPKASADQATKRIPGPMHPKNGNATQGGGINRSTQGKP